MLNIMSILHQINKIIVNHTEDEQRRFFLKELSSSRTTSGNCVQVERERNIYNKLQINYVSTET